MGRLYDRILDTVKKLKPAISTPLQPIQEPDLDEPEELVEQATELAKKLSYVTEASIVHLIRQAAQHRLLIQLYYNNEWRFAEPYALRPGKFGTLFWAHDLLRNSTRSYYLHKIVEMKPTATPFNPRWTIEIN